MILKIDYQAKHKSITQDRIEEAIESDIYIYIINLWSVINVSENFEDMTVWTLKYLEPTIRRA